MTTSQDLQLRFVPTQNEPIESAEYTTPHADPVSIAGKAFADHDWMRGRTIKDAPVLHCINGTFQLFDSEGRCFPRVTDMVVNVPLEGVPTVTVTMYVNLADSVRMPGAEKEA